MALVLVVARTCYFGTVERTWVIAIPPHQCIGFVVAIEARNVNEHNLRDVLNPTIVILTTLGHLLTIPGQVKKKMMLLVLL